MKLLEDRIAVVTGAATGIGRGIAEVFALNGAHVVVADIKDDEARETALVLEKSSGKKSLAHHLDVTDPENVIGVFDEVVNVFGRIDVLVNNAGIIRTHYIIDFPLGDWQNIFKVNVEGVFLCSQAAARHMIRQGTGGAIINISSCAANKADRKHSAYSASKAAVITFTRVLALELGEHNIRANAILPGATGPTDMLQNVFDTVPGIEQELISKTTLGKLATPRDQGNAALFLASDLASHITGEYLIVSGGEFMNA
jgi:NAD(P)-dependent dehydrogenase (short-subunit alcohol dehydrogenase family)